jgi:ElaB/YqjD/DUF883 family membrane-anchored ribosome-binding protein
MADTKPKRAAKPKAGDAKRTELKSKVAAAQKRNTSRSKEQSLGDYARDAGSSATSFVKEHPITTVVGGLALGVLIASFLPGGRKVRKQASAKSAALAAALSELALTYGGQLLEGAGKAASTGREKLGDLGEVLGDGARSAGRTTSEAAGTAGDSARDFGKAAVRTLRDLRSRMAH